MKKITINVPSGTKYLSRFKDESGRRFSLPNGVLNKELTGCGGTTLALEDENKTIICSPRRKLIENKAAQYRNSLLVIEGVSAKQIAEYIKAVSVPKILTTYDSFSKVKAAVGSFEGWKVVVDEFQALLNDSAFKADTELAFLKELESCPFVTYLSATPILDKYISQIDFFKDKTYYQLNWADKEKVCIRRIKTANPLGGAISVIKSYKQGFFPTLEDEAGNVIESKEAVIFLNSVTDIANIIKQTELQPEEVNIIVADNSENQKLIKQIGEAYKSGTIPLKGEEHKTFTFCTSTAYMGVDFYSPTASTFVISNCKKVSTAVDIATELCQIAGRQRLESNPFRRQIFFIYNTTRETLNEAEFERVISEKSSFSRLQIDNYKAVPADMKPQQKNMILNICRTVGYYIAYNEAEDSFEYNILAELSDRLAYEVQNHTYKNGLMVRKELEATNKFNLGENQAYVAFSEGLRGDIQRNSFRDKMKDYISYKESDNKWVRLLSLRLSEEDSRLRSYYDLLGADRIRALSCDEANLKREVEAISKEGAVEFALKKVLHTGQRITKAELKALIQQHYNRLGLKKTAKATDITKFGFDSKEVKIKEGGRYVNGVELFER